MAELDRDQLLAVLEVLPVGVSLLTPELGPDGAVQDFRFVFSNASIRSSMNPSEVAGVRLSEHLAGGTDSPVLTEYRLAYERDDLRAGPQRLASVDGKRYEVQARRVDDLLLIQVEDVTAQWHAEQVEADAHRRVAQTLERINDAVYSLDRSWRFTFVNAEAGQLLGWDPADLVGRNLWDTFPGTVGSRFERSYRHAVAYGETVAFEAYYPEPLDAWFAVRAYPGEHGLTVFFQNVDARHRIEERAVDLERLESAAALAHGALHDFNNQLMVIAGHAELLAESLPPGDPRHEDVGPIREAAAKATERVQRLLTFARSHDPAPAVVDLNSVVTDDQTLLRDVLPRHVRLELVPAPEPVLVDVDPVQLERALVHLASNGSHAMSQGGTLTVSVTTTQVDDDEALAHPERAPGWYGVLTVADDGDGMVPEVRDHALDPFFTTRPHATGLGLSAVDGLVRRAGGFLTLTSAPGTGTSVALHLPRSTADPAPS